MYCPFRVHFDNFTLDHAMQVINVWFFNLHVILGLQLAQILCDVLFFVHNKYCVAFVCFFDNNIGIVS